MNTAELLEGLRTYLVGAVETPDVLFAGADFPDDCVVCSVVDENPGLGDFDVSLTWRATGVEPARVERFADTVFEHFRSVIGVRAATFQGGTAVVLPELAWVGGITVLNIERLTRGPAELTSPAKHSGSRFVRTDVYRITAFKG